MLKIRQSLGDGKRGNQKALGQMRCVDKSTLSTWQITCDVLDAVDGKVDLSQLSTAQPTHTREIGRALRRQEKTIDGDKAAEWIERVEDEKLTVAQLKKALVSERRNKAAKKVKQAKGEAVKAQPMEDFLKSLSDVDAIITDPPYPHELRGYEIPDSILRDCWDSEI